MKIVDIPSPNQNMRANGVKPFMLILHYTGTKTWDEADQIYRQPDQVSPHYMIDRDGRIARYVDEEQRAWHAGLASWDGHDDINSCSIGIEIVNGGHEFGLENFPETQIAELIKLIQDIRSRWTIPNHYILGHSDIAPGRKIDPGEKFPWRTLHQSGIGLLPKSSSGEVIAIARGLKQFGYDYTDNLDILKQEFCRHYLYESFPDINDAIISAALHSLINQKLTAL